MKLFIALMLVTSSAFARDLSCVLTDGQNRDARRVTIADDAATTEINFGKRGEIVVKASARYDYVNVSIKANGATFQSNGYHNASIDMISDDKAALNLSCRIVEDPIGC
jgi:hypothetical protein